MPTTNTTFTYKFSDGSTVEIPTQHRTWLSITEKGNIAFNLEDDWKKKLDSKEIEWKELPQPQRDAYSWRKATFAKEETIKNAMISDTLSKAYATLEAALKDNAEALLALNTVKDTVKKLQKKTAGKYSLMAKLFGKEKASIGDSIAFSMDIVGDLAKLQAKGYEFELKNNRMVVTKVPSSN